MTFQSTPPSAEGLYYATWRGEWITLDYDPGDWNGEEYEGSDILWGPRIPSPQELEALEACAVALRAEARHEDDCPLFPPTHPCDCYYANYWSALDALREARS